MSGHISDQIVVYKNDKVLVELRDKLKVASVANYAHIHATGEQTGNGTKRTSGRSIRTVKEFRIGNSLLHTDLLNDGYCTAVCGIRLSACLLDTKSTVQRAVVGGIHLLCIIRMKCVSHIHRKQHTLGKPLQKLGSVKVETTAYFSSTMESTIEPAPCLVLLPISSWSKNAATFTASRPPSISPFRIASTLDRLSIRGALNNSLFIPV